MSTLVMSASNVGAAGQACAPNPKPACETIVRIARRLVALNEYSMEQALFVATDIVRWRLFHKTNE